MMETTNMATEIEPNEPTVCGIQPYYEVCGRYTGEVLATCDTLQEAVDFIKRYDLFSSHAARKVTW